jgi:hypothetical protein
MRRLLALVASVVVIAGCGTVVPTPNPSGSLAVSTRIAEIGQGQDWYGVIHQVNGRPDAIRIGPQDGWFPVDVRLNPGVDPGSSIVSRACDAIAAAVSNTQYGPSLQVTVITLLNSAGSHECRPPGDTMPGSS